MILKTEEITKKFGGITAVEKVSLTIPENKITSIIGPNGSGKSTLFNVITKLLPSDHGKISIKNQDTTSLADHEIARKTISRTFQEIRIFPYLTIREHLELALYEEEDKKLLKSFFKPKSIPLSSIEKILDLVGLDKEISTRGENLSYGQSKLLNLAMSIAKRHEILLLDEPVAGVNPRLRKKISDILLDLKKRGETILLIEHDMNFVVNLSDLIIVMDGGKIILEGDRKKILSNKKVLKAYLGR